MSQIPVTSKDIAELIVNCELFFLDNQIVYVWLKDNTSKKERAKMRLNKVIEYANELLEDEK